MPASWDEERNKQEGDQGGNVVDMIKINYTHVRKCHNEKNYVYTF